MIGVNFIVTCHDREAYWPYLRDIILSYKEIASYIAFCYNGKDNGFPCDFKCGNRTGSFARQTDGELIVGGFNKLKSTGCDKWIKLSVDSWLCDEKVVIGLLNKMTEQNYHYAGCKWYNRDNQYSTDIIFADTLFMQKFTDYITASPQRKIDLEHVAAGIAKQIGGAYMIPERTLPSHRYICPPLGWTMQHELKKNVEFLKAYNG